MSDTPEHIDHGLDDVEPAVTALVEDIYASLMAIAAATRKLWDRIDGEGATARSADLAVLRGVVTGELRRQGNTFNGAGLVVADGLLADCPRYLEWWRPDPKRGGPAQKLTLDLNPNSEYFYDYTTMASTCTCARSPSRSPRRMAPSSAWPAPTCPSHASTPPCCPPSPPDRIRWPW